MVQRSSPEDRTDRLPGEARPLRVLVVEDHPTNRRLVQTMLEPLGFAVSFAENGAEGVAACRRERFDLVLMDMQMPVMDGLSAVRHIRADERLSGSGRPCLPIAMISAIVGPEYEAAALQAGADAHIGKPFSLADLLRGIAGAMVHARPDRARRIGS